jgi:hypothetical protein
VIAPVALLRATIRTEQYPVPPLQADSAEYRAMISLVVPEGTNTPTEAPGMSTKTVELLELAVVSLATTTRSMKPPLANDSTAKAAPLANTSATAMEASKSIVRLTCPLTFLPPFFVANYRSSFLIDFS